MNHKINISEGYSLNYLIHAFFFIAVGILLFKVHYLLASLDIILGGLLLLVKTGVILDIVNQKAIIYKSILGLKNTDTINLKNFYTVRLQYDNTRMNMPSRGPSNSIKTKSYKLFLGELDNKEELFYEFTDYQLAMKTFKILTSELNMEGFDKVPVKY